MFTSRVWVMKVHLNIIFTQLYFSCYECTPDIFGTCTGTKTPKQCPSETNQCVVSRMFTFVGKFAQLLLVISFLIGTDSFSNGFSLVSDGRNILDSQDKGCNVEKICSEGSVNYGTTIKTVVKNTCCTGELCDNYNIPGNLYHDFIF